MPRTSTIVRAGAALAGASIAMMLAAPAAGATEEARGRVDRDADQKGYEINLAGHDRSLHTANYKIDLRGGESLRVYCVEIGTSIKEDQDMVERPWNDFPDSETDFHANRDKINWVLHHGYPFKDLETIEQDLEGTAEFNDGLSKREAITATQAAVWHYSDGVDLDKESPLAGAPDPVAADVLALYGYLTNKNNNTGISEPDPALELTPADATGKAGERIGPFTVSTSGEIQKLVADGLPEGATLTDADGKELTAADITDGTEIFVHVPEDAEEGKGSFGLKASAAVNTGRLFVGENYDKVKAQSLIVATSDKLKLSDEAMVRWSAAGETPPTTETSTTTAPSTTTEAAPSTTETPVAPQSNEGPLAQTGFSAMTPLVIGLVLLGGGAVTLLILRRRKGTASS
ncbi:thioester domain-containing protein [Amycolatopsis cihanbeyliensis]|uniref:TQXA domain-containing protein n=1 Tax=Amycolatopsis cihanbeyliensis TaxID=1128664 RepID=A0A542DLK8_AMYCI|nr:thioester domain-containing protein [Amycolatopsis cihanbeyliensis]TQJ03959.1 TQXA domain-containing protein [Amycolatopsis cihanbeyliensis]